MAAAFPLQAVKLKSRTEGERVAEMGRLRAIESACRRQARAEMGVAAQKKASQIRFVYDTHGLDMPHTHISLHYTRGKKEFIMYFCKKNS